jgi:ABC-type transport system substrate-binding protein
MIDHDEWLKAWSEVYFGGSYYASFFAPALDTWDLPQEEFKKSIFFKQPKDDAAKEAISLLNAAGYNQQNPLKFEIMGRGDTPDGQASAQLLQAQWRRFSGGIVDTQLRMLESAAYQAARGSRDYTYSAMSQAASFVEPDAWFKQCYKTNATRNYFGNSDPQLDKMIDDQGRIFDSRQRKAAILDTLRYMLDKSPGIVAAGYYWLNATKPNVRGFKPEVQPQGQAYENIWLDSLGTRGGVSPAPSRHPQVLIPRGRVFEPAPGHAPQRTDFRAP